MKATMTIKELFKNLVHIGHKPSRWNPKMKPYLFTKQNGIYIFDLEKTLESLKKAQNFLSSIKTKNGKVIFVGTKPQISLEIQSQVPQTNHYYVNQKWIPGLLTNFKEIRKRIDYYLNLKSQFENNEIQKYTKKEVSNFKKELEKLDASFSGVAEMRKKPDVAIILDGVTDQLAIEESRNVGIPVIVIVDANADPEGIDYPIPGNDDSIKSIHLILEKLIEPL